MSEFFNLFSENLIQTTWIEVVAVVFGLLSVWYARKENILVFPTGIISVLIYVYICFFAGLYADMGINGFYFVMSVYGWYKWTHRDSAQQTIVISFNTLKQHLISIAGTIVFFVILYYLLSNYTDSTVPAWDSATTAIFIVGMWLMALKKVENWIYWIIGDFVSIPLYFYKGLALTSFQFTVFLILAVWGYIEWRNKVKEQQQ